MSVIEKIKIKINSLEFLMYLLGASLSVLLIGFAPSGILIGIFSFFSLRYFILNKKKLDLRLNFTLLLPFLLYVYFLLTYFWSVDKEQTLKGFERMMILALVPLAFSAIPKIPYKSYRLVLDIFTIGNAVLCVFFLCSAFYNFINTQTLSIFTYHELVSVLDLNAIYVTLILSVSFFYLLSLSKKTTLEKWLLVFFLVIIFLLSSKIIILVLFLGVLIFLFKNKFHKLNNKKIIICIALTILGLSISSITLFKRFKIEQGTEFREIFNNKAFGKVYYWTGSSIRLFQLRILKEQIDEESILLKGFGLFASKKDIKKRHKHYDTYYAFHKYNYHNQYAQIVSEAGIIGLTILLIMLTVLIIKAIKSKDYGFIMFSVMIISIFFTESILWRQRGLFLFTILYCLYLRTLFGERSLIK
jgi:O-antigen ligase